MYKRNMTVESCYWFNTTALFLVWYCSYSNSRWDFIKRHEGITAYCTCKPSWFVYSHQVFSAGIIFGACVWIVFRKQKYDFFSV